MKRPDDPLATAGQVSHTERQDVRMSLLATLLFLLPSPSPQAQGHEISSKPVSVDSEKTIHLSINEAVERLLNGHPGMQQWAIPVLAAAGKPAVPILLNQLDSAKNGGATERIGEALRQVLKKPSNRDEKTLTELSKLTQPGPYPRVSVALSCIALYEGDPRAKEILAHFSQTYPIASVRGVGIGYFYSLTQGSKLEIPFYRTFLRKDEDDRMKVVVAGLLGLLGDKSGLPFVKELLRRKGTSREELLLQQKAADAAGKLGDSSLIADLISIRDDPKRGNARPSAHEAIAWIELQGLSSDDEKIQFLKKKINDPGLSYWAGMHLKLIGTQSAEHVLREASEASHTPGQAEGSRWYHLLLQQKSDARKE